MDTVRRKNCLLPIREIKPNPRNARTHSKAQIRQIAESIKALGLWRPRPGGRNPHLDCRSTAACKRRNFSA